MRHVIRAGALALAITACSDQRPVTAPAALDPSIVADRGEQHSDLRGGAVFAMTNQVSGNAITAFSRASDGSLTLVGSFPTGGMGAGSAPDPLRSQGSLVFDDEAGEGERALLFAVDAGSNEISVMSVNRDGLTLVDKVSSGGVKPTSLAVHRDLLYVLNAMSGTINGFRIGHGGELTPIAASERPITGGAGADPSQISFSPDGRLLVVDEKTPKNIDTYQVADDGTATGPRSNPSSGIAPFGFAFARDRELVVSEAFGGAPAAGAVSSYTVSRDGAVTVVSPSVHNGQSAPCWLVITNDNRYVYVANTGSSDLSSYFLSADGTLTLLDPVAATTDAGGTPIDTRLTIGSKFLYVLNDVTGTIDGYSVGSDGSLARVAIASGMPPNAQGLAAR